MSKRIIALICLFALMLGFVPATTVANAAANQYKVGYSKKSINPFITNDITGEGVPAQYTDADGNLQDYTDLAEHRTSVEIHTGTNPEVTASVPFIAIPLAGYGTQDNRLANFMSDDNGDGLITVDDGLFVTATYVTDLSGNAVVFLNFDLLSASENVVEEVKTRVIKKVKELDPTSNLLPDQIIPSGSHNHSGPYTSTLVKAYTTWAESVNYDFGTQTPNTLYAAYFDYMASQMAEAVAEAYLDRKDAQMSKGTISASEAMKELGYTYTDSTKANYGEGFVMNGTRHISVTHKQTIVKSYRFGGSQVSKEENTYHYTIGNNFGSPGSLPELGVDHVTEEIEDYIYTVTTTDHYTADHVNKADDSLKILQFTREGAEPVLLIDWSAHASMMGNNSKRAVASDFVNALRYYLEQRNYCVGFWQGAGGNVNGGSYLKAEYKMAATPEESVGFPSVDLDENKAHRYSEDTTGFYKTYYDALLADDPGCGSDAYRSGLYGYLLGKIALKCLETKMSKTLDMGDIHVLSIKHYLDEQTYSEGWAAAAANLKAAEDALAEGETITYPWVTEVDGKPYVINSKHHANTLYKRTASDSTWGEGQQEIILNVILMGKNVAMVAASGELFNHYDSGKSGAAEDNDWLELNAVLGETYGAPFILSHTSGSTGYLPNTASYDYEVIEGTVSGSYEVNVSDFARGSGEEVIQLLKEMLKMATAENAFPVAYCKACKKDVAWTPVYWEMRNTDFTTGHYYLAEDLNGSGSTSYKSIGVSSSYVQKQADHAETVCLDLCGNSFYNSTRCFLVRRYSTLSIVDTVGGGEVQGMTATNNPAGGTYIADKGSCVNLYGGTHSFAARPNERGTGWGGVFNLSGTLNIYDGARIEGAEMVISAYTGGGDNNGCGGAVFASSGSTINAYGGTITSGSVPEGGYGPCIFVSKDTARITVSGNANIEDIYFNAIDSNGKSLTVDGNYTGKLGLTINTALTNGKIIGKVANGGSIANGQITVANDNVVGLYVKTDESYLRVRVPKETHVAIANIGGFTNMYTSLGDAVAAAGDNIVKLLADITSNVTLTTNANIDLAGHSITGTLTTADGCKIKMMDSATDDFDVSDGVYGKVKITSSNRNKIVAVTQDDNLTEDSYLMITESSNVSFHRIKLQINSMSLRPSVSGLYYSSTFAGDEKVAELIAKNGNDEVDFGVALSIKAHPNAENLDTKCLYSKFTGFKAGAGANDGASTSTMLVNVINPDRADFENEAYADLKVFGRAFVVLPNGQYLFSKIVARSLRQQVEATDTAWKRLNHVQRDGILDLYENYDFMAKWTLSNTKAANAEDDGVLRILEVGNSHGLDSTNLLAEVIQKETGKKVVIGALYYSGCSVSQHASFMLNNRAEYSYYKNATFTEGVEGINGDGSWKIEKDTTALRALQDEDWDIITLQQMNNKAGMDAQYSPTRFNIVLNYLKENKKNPQNEPIMLWHMVWTNPDDAALVETSVGKVDGWISDHESFFDSKGNYDMDILYDNIIRCTQKYIVGSGEYADVIPAGTAIQYAKSILNRPQTELYRDYTHMSDYGRLISAYVWYAKLFGISSIDDIAVTEIPSYLHHDKSSYPSDLKITADMKADLIKAVNWALKNPYSVG